MRLRQIFECSKLETNREFRVWVLKERGRRRTNAVVLRATRKNLLSEHRFSLEATFTHTDREIHHHKSLWGVRQFCLSIFDFFFGGFSRLRGWSVGNLVRRLALPPSSFFSSSFFLLLSSFLPLLASTTHNARQEGGRNEVQELDSDLPIQIAPLTPSPSLICVHRPSSSFLPTSLLRSFSTKKSCFIVCNESSHTPHIPNGPRAPLRRSSSQK